MWWHPANFRQKKDNLLARQAIIQEIRQFFHTQGFLAVETPILQTCPTMDAHIHGFVTELRGVDLEHKALKYLQSSPEFEMKKLLVAGAEKIYQICHVFRNGENSPRHSCEFTMVEWYRANADYRDIMKDCERLLRACANKIGLVKYGYKGATCNPHIEWGYLSVEQAFELYASIDITKYLDDTEGFRTAVAAMGLHTAKDDAWDDLFFRVMDARIEPHLGMTSPTILYDYPASMASLSRKKNDDLRFAERFELYICGVEVANAFSELTDATEQRARFEAEMVHKRKLYGEAYPIDEDFLDALEFGLPESGGIALGIDRLVMLSVGAEDINDVLWCEKV